MGKPTTSGGGVWKFWLFIFLLAIAFLGGFIPQYFRAQQLEKRLQLSQESFYRERISSSLQVLHATLARCRLHLCLGSGLNAQKELQKFYADLESLHHDPTLKENQRESIRTWLKEKRVNISDINPPRLQIQDRLQTLDKELTQMVL